jgi:hypothetical protein
MMFLPYSVKITSVGSKAESGNTDRNTHTCNHMVPTSFFLNEGLTINRMFKSHRMKWVQHIAHIREIKNAHKILRSLGRPRHRWENNIKMNLKGCGLDSTDTRKVSCEHSNEF